MVERLLPGYVLALGLCLSLREYALARYGNKRSGRRGGELCFSMGTSGECLLLLKDVELCSGMYTL
jgi:hypothetical protein